MFHVSDPGRNEVKENAMAAQQQPLPVKLEIVEDPLEEEFGPLNKRSKTSAPFHQELQQQLRPDSAAVSAQHATDYNPFNEPSPLGLRLRKSPSLLDLIQMKISQTHSTMPSSSSNDYHGAGKKKDSKSTVNSGTAEKLKASNFPASLLRIGTWEYISRYEGDLVAKCYFAKHKLVWEVLDGGLKSKIEIQWSDIIVLKASCQENKPGTLDIVLSRQPLFFKETNPQPRKHTLWQATSDFTGGQASIHRKHFLQCAPGLLGKHFDKLIQCDPRLYSLSQQPDIVLDSPYFESKCSVFEDQEEPNSHIFNHVGDYGQSFSGFHDVASTCSASPTSSRSDARDPTGRVHDYVSRETPSPSSVMDTRSIEELTKCETEELKDHSHWDQFKVPGLHQSMSVNDLVNHIGNCITGQMSTDNPLFAGSTFSDKENKKMLEDITQYLLGDSQTSSASDENSLMSRVNSLCCLLQKDPSAVQNLQPVNKDEVDEGTDDEEQRRLDRKPGTDLPAPGHDDASPRVQASMSRKDSIGDLLMNLPRIASLPQFLFNISEDA